MVFATLDSKLVVSIYGIKNCSTMAKAFAWLEEQDVAYHFHDYKKAGIEAATLAEWARAVGWQTLLNTRGTTWRGLSEAERTGVDAPKALALMQAKPSLIKRPVIVAPAGILVGYDEGRYAAVLKG